MCNEVDVLQVIVILKTIFEIIAACIPLAMVVFWIIDFAKAVVSNKNDAMITQLRQIFYRFIIAILIVLSPHFIDVVLNNFSRSDVSYACLENISAATVRQMYVDRADDALAVAEESLEEKDLAQARRYVNDIQDNELRKEFTERLKTTKAKIEEKKKEEVIVYPETPVSPQKTYGEFPYYNQCVGAWASKSINGHGTYCSSGCGYTSLAMISSYLNSTTITPNDVGSKLGLSSALPYQTLSNPQTMQSKLGITPTPLYELDPTKSKTTDQYKKSQIVAALRRGEPIVAYVPGHYIVLASINGDKISVRDPGSSSKTKEYTIDEVFNTYNNYKSRCSNSGGTNCGLKYAVSFKEY